MAVPVKKDEVCDGCGCPTPSFQNTDGFKWLGHPVLYMGKDRQNHYALKYQFCDAECMIEWLADVLGMTVE